MQPGDKKKLDGKNVTVRNVLNGGNVRVQYDDTQKYIVVKESQLT